MEYTKSKEEGLAALIDWHYKDYVKNIQLSTEDYYGDRNTLVQSILEETAAPDLYEACKMASAILREIPSGWVAYNKLQKAIAKADGGGV